MVVLQILSYSYSYSDKYVVDDLSFNTNTIKFVNKYSMRISYFSSGGELKGPLKVLPPDNENNELDACSILCLQSNPPVLVVATLSGTLQHLALLQDSEVGRQFTVLIIC